MPSLTQKVLDGKHNRAIRCISTINTTVIVPLGATPYAGKPSTQHASLRATSQIDVIKRLGMLVNKRQPNIHSTPPGKSNDLVGGVHIYDVYVEAVRAQLGIAVTCFSRGCSERSVRHFKGAAPCT